MTQPQGFIDRDHPRHVCKLCKAIYGLKQAPHTWYHELRQFLLTFGLTNSHADTSLFISNTDGNLMYLLVYVDDIIITGASEGAEQTFIHLLASRFSLKDLGPLAYFLGVEVMSHAQSLLLSQRKYIKDLLTRTHMMDAKPVSTPLSTDPLLTFHSGPPLFDPFEYRTIVGSLQYLSFTHLDVAYMVTKLSQFIHHPTSDHWIVVKRLLHTLLIMVLFYIGILAQLSMHSLMPIGQVTSLTTLLPVLTFFYLGRNTISWSSKKK